ncbi:MAG: PQQ-binding-like beta-propeller repeat protein [Gemmataceae bacterium]
MRYSLLSLLLLGCGCCSSSSEPPPATPTTSTHADWPLFGGTPARNMVNPTAKNIPATFSADDKDSIRWIVELGSKAYGGPVVAGGKVFVGTNNANPRDPKEKGNLAVLQCYDAAKGTFLWQITHPMPEDEIFNEVTKTRMGLLSTPVVDKGMVYYVTPGAEVVAATTDGKVKWSFDMLKKLKIHPYHCSNCSPLVVDDLIVLLTGNGIAEGGKVVAPKAPSFIALKKDGTLAWQSSLPGADIIEGQWSNPSLAVVGGKKQLIFPGGDGVVYALKPEDGSLIWKFSCYPKGIKREDGDPTPAYFVSTPVAQEDRIYIGMGTMPEHPTAPRFSYFLCIDATKSGDISPKTLTSDAKENKGTGLVWSYGGAIVPRPMKGRPVNFGPTISTAAVTGELVFIAEEAGYLHCLDRKTGKRHWMHDFKSAIWGSPYVVDGKVFCGVEDGILYCLAADAKLKVMAENDMGELIHGTPVASGDTLYVLTRSKLFAIGAKK